MLSRLVISAVILSVSTFWIAGSWISGSTVATYRPVSETSVPAQTPITATGASTQPRTIRTTETMARQLMRRRRTWPVPWLSCAAVAARRRSSSARSSGLSSRFAAAGADSPLMSDKGHLPLARGPSAAASPAAASLVHVRARIHSPSPRVMRLTSSVWGELSRAGGRAGVVARIGPPFPAPAYGPEQEPRAGAQQREVAEHLDDKQY